jgi:hypothetical protein
MTQWESQIRTNLSDSIYAQCLSKLMKTAPGTLQAGLVNTLYEEGHVNLESGRAADEQTVATLIELAVGLFAAGQKNPTQGALAELGHIRPLKSVFLALEGEKVLIEVLQKSQRALVITVAGALNIGAAQAQLLRVTGAAENLGGKGLRAALEPIGEILAGACIDLEQRKLLETYRRYDDVSNVNLDSQLVSVVCGLLSTQSDPVPLRLNDRKGEELLTLRAQLTGRTRTHYWARMPFDLDHFLMVAADQKAIQGLVWIAINQCLNDVVRLWVDGLLNYGIETAMAPFPKTQSEFLGIVDELGKLHKNDLLNRLIIGGFANHGVGAGEDLQRCQECIYYLPHAKWCDLPELPIPVEPQWWCRLWKL